MIRSIKVLLVATSSDTLGDEVNRTGVWLEEIAAPYCIFKDGGAYLTIASPKGGKIPVDPQSEAIDAVTKYTGRFTKDTEAMNHLQRSQLLHEMKDDMFDVLFIAGGAGALYDLSANHSLKQLLDAFIRNKKPVGAIGYGVAALLPLMDEKGQPWVKGKSVTGASIAEEDPAGSMPALPFHLQTKLEELGARYTSADKFVDHVVEEASVITGQNPASAEETAKSTLALIRPIFKKVKKLT